MRSVLQVIFVFQAQADKKHHEECKETCDMAQFLQAEVEKLDFQTLNTDCCPQETQEVIAGSPDIPLTRDKAVPQVIQQKVVYM